jgi:hypothetical protein
VVALVLEYYVVLRSVLATKAHLRRCRTRCPDCGIFFLTHPCNLHQRGQIRCPFGCRAEHRRREAIGRSRAYYSGQKGKEMKKKLNQRRCRLPARAPGQEPVPTRPASRRAKRRKTAAQVRSAKPSPVMVQHVRMVVSLIEGRRVSRRQVLLWRTKILRQHTLTRRPRMDHAVLWLHKQPP